MDLVHPGYGARRIRGRRPPHYNFEWQFDYVAAKPIKVPKGTKADRNLDPKNLVLYDEGTP